MPRASTRNLESTKGLREPWFREDRLQESWAVSWTPLLDSHAVTEPQAGNQKMNPMLNIDDRKTPSSPGTAPELAKSPSKTANVHALAVKKACFSSQQSMAKPPVLHVGRRETLSPEPPGGAPPPIFGGRFRPAFQPGPLVKSWGGPGAQELW